MFGGRALRPDPLGESLSTLPDSLAAMRGLLLRGRGGKERRGRKR